MLIARGTNNATGEEVLLLGLSTENLRRLQTGDPVHHVNRTKAQS